MKQPLNQFDKKSKKIWSVKKGIERFMGSNTGNDDINNTYHIKMAVLEELRHTLKVKRINDELLEHLASTLRWLLRYAEINNIILPEKDKIVLALDRAMEIAEKCQVTN